MTKIYNEVVIDMNPESSSYGETLYEDSFEHEGPVPMLAMNLHGDYHYGATSLGSFIEKVKTFEQGGNRFHVIRTSNNMISGKTFVDDDDNYVIIDADGKVVSYANKGWIDNTSNFSGDASAWAEEYISNDPKYGAAKGEDVYGMDTAQKVSYSDFSKFMDPATGKVTDVNAMANYLKTHGLEGMGKQQIIDSLPNMPGVNISAADIAGAKAKQTSDIYGIQTGMTEARAEGSAAAGAAGIYSPTSTGFGGKAEDAYAQLGAMSQQEGGDVYGLSEGKEQELVDWMAKLTTS